MAISVVSATNSQGLGYPAQRQTFIAHGRFWVFYHSGLSLYFRSRVIEPLGAWSAATTADTTSHRAQHTSIWFDGTYVHLSHGSYNMGDPLYYRRGTPSAAGTITWGSLYAAVAGVHASMHEHNGITVDSAGYPVIGWAQSFGGSGGAYDTLKIKIATATNGSTWGAETQLDSNADVNVCGLPILLPLASRKFLVIWTNNALPALRSALWNGSSFEATQTIVSRNTYIFSAVLIGSRVLLMYPVNGELYSKRWTEDTWAAPKLVCTGTTGALTVAEDDETVYAFAYRGSGTSSKLLGTADAGDDWDISENGVSYQKFTAAATGTVASIRVKSGVAGKVKVAIYDHDDVGDKPVNVLVTGAADCVVGWNTIEIFPIAVIEGTDYWLASVSNTKGTTRADSASLIRTAFISLGTTPFDSFLFPGIANYSNIGQGHPIFLQGHSDIVTSAGFYTVRYLDESWETPVSLNEAVVQTPISVMADMKMTSGVASVVWQASDGGGGYQAEHDFISAEPMVGVAPKLIIEHEAPIAAVAPKLIIEHEPGDPAVAPKLVIEHEVRSPVEPKLIIEHEAGAAIIAPKLVIEHEPFAGAQPPRLIIEHTPQEMPDILDAGVQIFVRGAWRDISEDVMQLSIKRGRMHELDRVEAGTAVLTLNNDSGDYWRYNPAGQWYPEIKPLTRIRIVKAVDAQWYSLFNGVIESWQPGWYGDIARGTPIVSVGAVDMFKRFSMSYIRGVYAASLPGQRISAVLSEIGWPTGAGWRSIDTGAITIDALDASVTPVRALEHLLDVAQADSGIFFMDGEGKAVFQDAQSRITGSYSQVRATLTKDDYLPMKLSDDDSMIFTSAQINDQRYSIPDEDIDSLVGQREYVKTLPILNDSDAAARAFTIVERYKESELRLPAIPIVPDNNPARLMPMVLGYDLSTKIQIQLDDPEFPATIDQAYHIEGIQHDWDAIKKLWKTQWQVWDVSKFRTAQAVNFDWAFDQGSTYLEAHGKPGLEEWNNHYFVFVGQYVIADPYSLFRIGRALIELDTTMITIDPVEATLFVCILELYDVSFHRPWKIQLVDPEGLTCPMDASDYGALRGRTIVWGESESLSKVSPNQWIGIPLNYYGIQNISKGGVTRIALRSEYDIAADSGGILLGEREDAQVHGVTAQTTPTYSYAPPYLIVKLS